MIIATDIEWEVFFKNKFLGKAELLCCKILVFMIIPFNSTECDKCANSGTSLIMDIQNEKVPYLVSKCKINNK